MLGRERELKGSVEAAPEETLQESLLVYGLKTLLLIAAAFAYSYHLVDLGIQIFLGVSIGIAAIFAWLSVRQRVRLPWIVLVALCVSALAQLFSWLILDHWDLGTTTAEATLRLSRIVYYSGLAFSVVYLTRSLSLRWRWTALLEFALFLGSILYLFFAHRNMNLHNPRDFADWAYSNAYDPVELYRWMGFAVCFVAFFFFIHRQKLWRILATMLILGLLALFMAQWSTTWRLPLDIEDPLGLKSDEDKNKVSEGGEEDEQGSSGGSNDEQQDGSGQAKGDSNRSGQSGNSDVKMPSNNEEPTPVALAVFYDSFEPAEGIFYFRQTVISHYDGNHLASSAYDRDVISTFPVASAQKAEPLQNASVHSKISTSMFLLRELAQPPQLAMGQQVFSIDNPDPKIFAAAYGVESLGLSTDVTRLIGHRSIPDSWPEDQRAHYLEIPDDPRYHALSEIIVRDIDMRFANDDMVKALAIKAWLEREGFYTLKTRHIDSRDPTASFLFGSLRGYCVHFAHAAVYLLRSQGIAARVAIGFASSNYMRNNSSALMIMGDNAHAWPEIHVDGIGWVSFDIYPEHSDQPPAPFLDRELESLFGELARDDKSGGKAEEPIQSGFALPWGALWWSLLALLLSVILGFYLRLYFYVYAGQRLRKPSEIYRSLRACIWIWHRYGYKLRDDASLERFIRRVAGPDSASKALVDLGLASKLGAKMSEADVELARSLLKRAKSEAWAKASLWQRLRYLFNPFVFI